MSRIHTINLQQPKTSLEYEKKRKEEGERGNNKKKKTMDIYTICRLTKNRDCLIFVFLSFRA